MELWTKVHLGLLPVALAILVVAGQGQHFFYDEWAFLGDKLGALPLPDRYLLPHNEHWSLLPLLAYRTLGATVGVASYWPYLGLLLLLHLGVTHVLWRLMLVTGSKPIVATALAATFSVLGAGAEDLVWAFQIGFVGSTLLGISAILLATTGGTNWRKTAGLTCLSTASLASSGVGLVYLIVVPLVLGWRRRRHAVVLFCLPLLVYLTWYAMYGRAVALSHHAWAPLPVMVGTFVIVGLMSALGRYLGFQTEVPILMVGATVVAGLALACRQWWADRTLAGHAALSMCAGAVIFFGTAGLARGSLGPGAAAASRYIYVAIALLLPGLALIVTHIAERHPRLMKAIIPVAFAIASSNVLQLLTFSAEMRQENDASRRVLVAATDLLSHNGFIFADQLPEPLLAPDLTTTDLRSGHLDAALSDIIAGPADRLTASLNLQIRVAPVDGATGPSTCEAAREQQITIPISRKSPTQLVVAADSQITLTLRNAGSRSAPRTIDLTKGSYSIISGRAGGNWRSSRPHDRRSCHCVDAGIRHRDPSDKWSH